MKTLLSLVCFFALCLPAWAQPNAIYGVVRIVSHGCSGTVISTYSGHTWILGCAHAYWDENERPSLAAQKKRHVIDIPSITKDPIVGNATVVAVDNQRDLSLLHLDVGPVPFEAMIPATDGYVPGRMWSCGYDKMRLPGSGKPQVYPATFVPGYDSRAKLKSRTKETPVPGRSGGAIIDERGFVIGVCSEYDTRGGGVYASLPSIQAFVKAHGFIHVGPGSPAQGPVQQQAQSAPPQKYIQQNVPRIQQGGRPPVSGC